MITILWVIFWFAVVGAAAWAVDTYVPMPEVFRKVFRIVVLLLGLLVLIRILSGGELVPLLR